MSPTFGSAITPSTHNMEVSVFSLTNLATTWVYQIFTTEVVAKIAFNSGPYIPEGLIWERVPTALAAARDL